MVKNKENILTITAVLALFATLGFYLLFDLLAAASLNLTFTAVFAVLSLVLGVYIFRSRPLPRKVILLGLLVTAVFTLRFVDWDSRKPFLRDFNQIQPGMTVTQVDEIMTGYFRSASLDTIGNEAGTDQSGIVSFRHTNEGWGDSDVGQITFDNGRVITSLFLPD